MIAAGTTIVLTDDCGLAKHYNPDAWAEHPCKCGHCGIIYARLRVDAKVWVRKALAQGDREGWVRLLDEVRGEEK